MFNFLDPKLLPKLTKTPLPTDSYDASNLISTVYSERIKGFIGYPSIKPPVEVEFQLLCNVNIAYIFINSSVGNQKCSGIEVFAKTDSGPYISIGKAVFDKPAVIFCNSRKYSTSNPPPGFNVENATLSFFKSNTYQTFLNSTTIKILIFRTEKSVPCLGKVEIWGFPAKSCSQKTVNTVLHLVQKSANLNSTTAPASPASSSANNVDFVIPEEFKDDLTYELMTIPYTLPSGKTIDQSTLEKHIESEKSFGRKPGDPFTGVKFTKTLKPVLNVALKSRIDMFLLKNSDQPQTFSLKRTLRNCGSYNKKFKHSDNSTAVESIYKNSDLSEVKTTLDSDRGFKSIIDGSLSSEYVCVLCKQNIESAYELPCNDCYCRACLLKICENCVCQSCEKTFIKGEVRKVHL